MMMPAMATTPTTTPTAMPTVLGPLDLDLLVLEGSCVAVTTTVLAPSDEVDV